MGKGTEESARPIDDSKIVVHGTEWHKDVLFTDPGMESITR